MKTCAQCCLGFTPKRSTDGTWALSITHIFGLLSGTSGDENLNQKNPL